MAVFEELRSSAMFITIVVTIAVFTDTLLYSLVIPLLPAILRTRAKIPHEQVETWVSALLAIYGGAALAAPLLVGPFTDRCKSKKTPFTLGLVVLSAGTLMFFWGRNIAILAVARALQGLSAIMVWTSGMTFMSARVGPERTGSAMGVVMAGSSCGELMGPAVGGLLYDYSGEFGVVIAAAAVISLDIVLRLLIIDPSMQAAASKENEDETEALLSNSIENSGHKRIATRNQPSRESYAHCSPDVEANLHPKNTITSRQKQSPDDQPHSKSVYAILLTNLDFWASLWAISIMSAVRTGLETTIPLFIRSTFDWSESKGGLVLLIMVAPSLLGPVFGRLNNRFGPRWPTCIAYFALGLLYIALGLATDDRIATRILFCFIICGIGVSVFQIAIAHMAAVSVVANDIGLKGNECGGKTAPSAKAFAMMSEALATGIVLGPLWAGPLHEHFGWLPMCASYAGACVLSAVFMAVRWKKWVPS